MQAQGRDDTERSGEIGRLQAKKRLANHKVPSEQLDGLSKASEFQDLARINMGDKRSYLVPQWLELNLTHVPWLEVLNDVEKKGGLRFPLKRKVKALEDKVREDGEAVSWVSFTNFYSAGLDPHPNSPRGYSHPRTERETTHGSGAVFGHQCGTSHCEVHPGGRASSQGLPFCSERDRNVGSALPDSSDCCSLVTFALLTGLSVYRRRPGEWEVLF